MGLRLHSVPPARGWYWIRQGFAVWFRRPIAFIGLLAFFLFVVMLLALVARSAGGLLGLALLPMLTLGFMVATRSALASGPVHPLQLADGLRIADRARRRQQWTLCVLYALGSLAIIMLSDWVDGGTFQQLQKAVAEQQPGKPSTELDELMADPRLSQGMLVRVSLAALLSVPFWHAPALVHWGGQGAMQSLFSSTLAMWQARGAFLVYGLGWFGLGVAMALAIGVASLAGNVRGVLGMLALPIALTFTAVFYVSLWFCFDDSFGAAEGDPGPGPSDPSDAGRADAAG